MRFRVPKSSISDIVLESKINEKLVWIWNRNLSHFRHWWMGYFWLILLSNMKAVRRQRMSLLNGMLNVFAHCKLLKTAVNYNTFWMMSRVARVFWKQTVIRFTFKISSFSWCARGIVWQVVLKLAKGQFSEQFGGVNLGWFAIKFRASVWGLSWEDCEAPHPPW